MPTAQGTPPRRTVDQTSHQFMCDALRGVLRRAVHAGPDAVDGIGSIQCRATAVLYLLLRDHPIDQRGRCRSCRHSGSIVGPRRRCCRIHLTASYWLLRQPDKAQLLSHLAGELGPDTAPPPGAASPSDHGGPTPTARNDPGDTDVLPRIDTEPLDLRIPRHQTPAVPPPLPPRGSLRAGRPDPAHGGDGDDPDGPRSRRAPLDPDQESAPHPGGALVLSGAATWT